MSDAHDQEKSTPEAFAILWSSLSHNQQRFAVAMLECSTKGEAAKRVGLKPNTVYAWGTEIDTAIDILRNENATAALGIIRANVTKAAQVKAEGLDSEDEKLRQSVATEILDRVTGRPTNRTELTGAEGGPVQIATVNVDTDKL